ncbi:Uncharacterized protein ToN1_37250 [Aromatoleum petrolei]|nr:Uncharacterized protein ToN1_37250 [Aromatoleum petrolei]
MQSVDRPGRQQPTVYVRETPGQSVLTVNHGISFLTSTRQRLIDGSVRALNPCEMSYPDVTGALMLADLFDRRPHMQA